MKRNTRNIRILAIVGMLGITGSLRAQQSADTPSQPPGDPATSTSAPATTTAATAPETAPAPAAPAATVAPTTSAVPAERPPPSADLMKQARLAGYRSKLKNGAYVFCKSDASTGTRFVVEKCVDQDTISIMLERVQAQRDELQHSMGCSGGSTCGGK